MIPPELVSGCASYLLSCQTYEGGFGGEPGNEAHGGYNFCTLAGLLILNAVRESVSVCLYVCVCVCERERDRERERETERERERERERKRG